MPTQLRFWNEAPPPETDTLAASPQDTAGDAWDRRFFRPLQRLSHLPGKDVKRRQGKAQIQFPRGLPLHEYAYHIEKVAGRNGIALVEAKEIRSLGRGPSALSYVLALDGDTLKLGAAIGHQVLAGSVRIAVVVVGLDSITLADAAFLQSLPFACNLALDPFTANAALPALQSGSSPLHFLLEMPMEPMAYPHIKPGKHAIYLHYGEAEVKAALDAALKLMPKAIGVATRYGDRVIENRPLLTRIFAYLRARDLALLDLTGSPRSLARDIAAETGGRSFRGHVLADSLEVEMEMARKVAMAAKTGEAVLVLRYSRGGLERLRKLWIEREEEFAASGIALTPFSQMHQSRAN